jgi:hypothetical protein
MATNPKVRRFKHAIVAGTVQIEYRACGPILWATVTSPADLRPGEEARKFEEWSGGTLKSARRTFFPSGEILIFRTFIAGKLMGTVRKFYSAIVERGPILRSEGRADE